MISLLKNLLVAPLQVILVWLEGFWALIQLVGIGLSALTGQGSLKDRLAAKLTAASTQRLIFSILRAFAPNISLSRVLMKCYENTGTAVVARREDVLDVLARDADFEVVYGTRMRKLTAGDNFFLGMQSGWDYERDVSDMRLAVRRPDVAEIVLPCAAQLAEKLVAESDGRLDLPEGLTLQIPWNMTATYFGVGGPTAAAMQGWTTTLFWYLFGDIGADPALDAKALQDAAALRDYLDGAITERRKNPTETDDVLNRCLALQSSGTPGMSDVGIRNNLLGLLIGAIPTISKASCLALDELLRRPDALAGAQAAAVAGDDDLMAQYVWEALRFNPHNPVIYRRATRDTTVARSRLRAMNVKKGQMVFAANFSAMFDRMEIPAPGEFRTDRPWETYIHWGYGMHLCFGDAINRALIPAIFKPLLLQKNLRRASGDAGQIDTGGTPFPQHFTVEFDPA